MGGTIGTDEIDSNTYSQARVYVRWSNGSSSQIEDFLMQPAGSPYTESFNKTVTPPVDATSAYVELIVDSWIGTPLSGRSTIRPYGKGIRVYAVAVVIYTVLG